MAKHKALISNRINKTWHITLTEKHWYKISLLRGKKKRKEESAPGLAGRRGGAHLHIDIYLVDVQPSAGVPTAPHSLLKHTLTHTHTLEKKTIPAPFRAVLYTPLAAASVAHLLRQLVGVEDAGHRHLQLVLLLLGLTQRRLPLLQEQVRRVLAGKLLQGQNQRGGVTAGI